MDPYVPPSTSLIADHTHPDFALILPLSETPWTALALIVAFITAATTFTNPDRWNPGPCLSLPVGLFFAFSRLFVWRRQVLTSALVRSGAARYAGAATLKIQRSRPGDLFLTPIALLFISRRDNSSSAGSELRVPLAEIVSITPCRRFLFRNPGLSFETHSGLKFTFRLDQCTRWRQAIERFRAEAAAAAA